MTDALSSQYDTFLLKSHIPTTHRDLSPSGTDQDVESLSSRPMLVRQEREETKSVLSRGLHHSKLIIHIVALAATAAVLQLSFRNQYSFDSGG